MVVIADRIAAIGGSLGVWPATVRRNGHLRIESALFDPNVSQELGAHNILSDARQRFERGVDPSLRKWVLILPHVLSWMYVEVGSKNCLLWATPSA